MRWPRKGVLIRLAIYVPLLTYFGWGAIQSCRARQDAERAQAQESTEDRLAPYKREIEMPDGTKREIYELTPEQAEQILGHDVDAKRD